MKKVIRKKNNSKKQNVSLRLKFQEEKLQELKQAKEAAREDLEESLGISFADYIPFLSAKEEEADKVRVKHAVFLQEKVHNLKLKDKEHISNYEYYGSNEYYEDQRKNYKNRLAALEREYSFEDGETKITLADCNLLFSQLCQCSSFDKIYVRHIWDDNFRYFTHNLTEKAVFDYILRQTIGRGTTQSIITVNQIAYGWHKYSGGVGVTPRTVSKHIAKLQEKGLLKLTRNDSGLNVYEVQLFTLLALSNVLRVNEHCSLLPVSKALKAKKKESKKKEIKRVEDALEIEMEDLKQEAVRDTERKAEHIQKVVSTINLLCRVNDKTYHEIKEEEANSRRLLLLERDVIGSRGKVIWRDRSITSMDIYLAGKNAIEAHCINNYAGVV